MKYFSGKKFKEIRVLKKLTQRELSENVSSQALISKIENEEIVPSDKDIAVFAKKLDSNIDDFYIEDISETLKQIETLIDEQIHIRAYSSAEFLLEHNKELLREFDLSYYTWRKSIVIYELRGQHEEAISLLRSIENTEMPIKRYYLIILSIASIYADVKEFELAFQYFIKIENFIENLDIDDQIKYFYNYSRSLYISNMYLESLRYIEKGIQLLSKYDRIKNMGHLYLLQANIFNNNTMYSKALNSLKYANAAYYIQNDEESLMRCHLLNKIIEENIINETTEKNKKTIL